MTSSQSEEEVVKRRRFEVTRQKKRKDLEELFDDEGSESANESFDMDIQDDEKSTLFREIFGTGREYNYIFERGKDEHEEEKETIKDTNQNLEKGRIDPKDAYEYIRFNMNSNNVEFKEITEMLCQGYNIHYILLHSKRFEVDIYTGYRICDLFEEYKTIFRQRIKSSDSNPNASRYDSLLGNDYFKIPDNKRYIIDDQEFERNFLKFDNIHKPEACRDGIFLDDLTISKLIEKYARNKEIRDYIVNVHALYGNVSGNTVIIDDYTRNCKLYRYLLLESDDSFNYKRKMMLDSVIEKILDQNTIIKIVSKIKEGLEQKRIFNLTIDLVYNGSISLLSNDDKVACVTKEGKLYKGVVLNYFGEVIDKISTNKADFNSVLDKISPKHVIISGFDPTIKILMQDIVDRNPIYAQGKYFKKYFKDRYLFTEKIGRSVICPEVEYLTLLHENVPFLECNLNEHLVRKTIYRAILTSISITGIDLNFILNQKNKEKILEFLGATNIFKIVKNQSYSELFELQEILDNEVDFNNLVTYLRLFKEYGAHKNVYDSLPIHTSNYHLADKILEVGKIDKNNIFEDIEKIKGINSTFIENVADIHGNIVYRIHECFFYNKRPVFVGCPDPMVFKELTGITENIIGQIIEGNVYHVGDRYYLILISNGVLVFMRTEVPLYLNQAVTVKIVEKNEAFVSFVGELVHKERCKKIYPRFCNHPFFKDLNSADSEKYLTETDSDFMLRRSFKDNFPVLVIRLQDGIFIHLKVDYNNGYSYKNVTYESIDELISKIVKKILKNVHTIRKHKHFFMSEDEANEYVKTPGDFIKYGFFLSKEYPGKICFIYNSKGLYKEYLTLSTNIIFQKREFQTLDDFLRYRKSIKRY